MPNHKKIATYAVSGILVLVTACGVGISLQFMMDDMEFAKASAAMRNVEEPVTSITDTTLPDGWGIERGATLEEQMQAAWDSLGSNKKNGLAIPSAGLVTHYVWADTSSSTAVNRNDCMRANNWKLNSNLMLGHCNKSFGLITEAEVGGLFLITDQDGNPTWCTVTGVPHGTMNDANTMIYDNDGNKMLGVHNYELVTCDSLRATKGRWVLQADQFETSFVPQ